MGGVSRSASRVILVVYRAAAPRAAAEPSRAGPAQPRLRAGEDAWERRELVLAGGWPTALRRAAGQQRSLLRAREDRSCWSTVHRASVPDRTGTDPGVRGVCI